MATAVVAPKGSLRHEGKPLAWWISELVEQETSTKTEAIRAIGEPAIPYLMARLRTNALVVPPWTRFLPERWNIEERYYEAYSQRRAEAVAGLMALGPMARSALPEILSLRNGRYVGEEYFDVILAIDDDVRKSLERAVRNGQRGMTVAILLHITPSAMGGAGQWPPELMESVRSLKTNADPYVRRAAFKRDAEPKFKS